MQTRAKTKTRELPWANHQTAKPFLNFQPSSAHVTAARARAPGFSTGHSINQLTKLTFVAPHRCKNSSQPLPLRLGFISVWFHCGLVYILFSYRLFDVKLLRC